MNTAKLEKRVDGTRRHYTDGLGIHLREAHWGLGLPQSMHFLFPRSSRFMSSCRVLRAMVWSIVSKTMMMRKSGRGLEETAGRGEHTSTDCSTVEVGTARVSRRFDVIILQQARSTRAHVPNSRGSKRGVTECRATCTSHPQSQRSVQH